MYLSATEKLKIIMMKRNMKQPELASLLNVTKQNVNVKFNKNNLSEKDLLEFSNALDCTFDIVFTMNDTKEKI